MLIGQTLEGKKIVQVIASGPTSYTTGGFTVTLGELRSIHSVSVSVRANARANDLVRQVDYSVSGNTLTVRVYQINTTTASPTTWAEVPAGTNLSSLVLEIVAIGI